MKVALLSETKPLGTLVRAALEARGCETGGAIEEGTRAAILFARPVAEVARDPDALASEADAVARACSEAGSGRLVYVSRIGAAPKSPSRYLCALAEAEARVRESHPSSVIARVDLVLAPGSEALERFTRRALAPLAFMPGQGWWQVFPAAANDLAEAIAKLATDEETEPGARDLTADPASLIDLYDAIHRVRGAWRLKIHVLESLVRLALTLARARGALGEIDILRTPRKAKKGDLEKLLGRPPVPLVDALREALAPPHASS